MARVDKVDLLGGLIICAVSAFFLIGSFRYGIGTITRMGPGYLPMVLGAIGLALGLVIAGLSLGRSEGLPRPSLRSMAAVLLSIASFAYLLERVGLVPTVMVAVGIAALADHRASPFGTLMLAIAIAAGSWLVFIALLGLPMRPYRWPF